MLIHFHFLNAAGWRPHRTIPALAEVEVTSSSQVQTVSSAEFPPHHPITPPLPTPSLLPSTTSSSPHLHCTWGGVTLL